jgi:general stress protein 26
MNHDSDQHKADLAHGPAVAKIREIVKSSPVCLFGTLPGHYPLTVRPMGVRDVDEVGNIWFLSGRSSLKNQHISREPRVQLFFTHIASSEYLSIEGFASVSDLRVLKEKYWTPLAKAWVPGGVEDPDLTVIKVTVTGGHYWDTEYGKAISLLKTAAAAVSGGKLSDGGVDGKLKP